ncbi:MAG TPA: secretin N-terminal domain-containing protein, partial [Candidatus Binatia bacterium]|nr:secretin N-terminal domain-containing protein [Candidatus Binatia bacterium]
MRTIKLIVSVFACALMAAVSAFAQTKTNAPAPAPAKPATDKNIRFHFDGIPYGDVVERFAQMAGKPLVSDTNVQGTLTYNDSRPYTYQEALDTLNVMLSMKGVTLVEDGNYLRLVAFKQLPQLGLKILRGLEQAGDVRPGEIVTVVLDMKNLDSKEVADAVQSMVSNAGSVAPLSRGRGLIITDRLANIQRVRALLNAIDTEAVADRQMKAFTLLHSSGAVVADLINRTFGLATAPKRTQYNPNNKNLEVLPPDPNDYITAVFDDASRTLVLFGPRERIALAEDLISKFEDKEGGGGDVRIYYPQITKAEELAQMIRQAIPGIAAPGETAAAAATKARVIADKDLNRLIVAAPIAGQLDQIEQLVNRLDKPIHGSGTAFAQTKSQTVQVTKVFRTRGSDAASVAKILSEALT